MLDGQCSRSRCQQNPAGICWGGTGSGAFSAEQFEVSSQSDCTGYVSAMLQASPMGGRRRSLADAEGNTTNTTARRALQSRGSADNMRNRRNAWVQGASSVLNAVADCATSGHRRAQAQGNETQGTLTAAEALQAFHNVTSRRRLSGCDYSSCSSCTSHADGGLFSSDQCEFCRATGECTSSWFSNCADGWDSSPSDCSGSHRTASDMRHCLNQKAASWVVHKCEDAACAYISGGCSPCVRLSPPLPRAPHTPLPSSSPRSTALYPSTLDRLAVRSALPSRESWTQRSTISSSGRGTRS